MWKNPLFSLSETELAAIGRAARNEYEARYTAATHCVRLIDIYRKVIEAV